VGSSSSSMERHNRPLKQPLHKVTVVHSDKEFLEDITGKGGWGRGGGVFCRMGARGR